MLTISMPNDDNLIMINVNMINVNIINAKINKSIHQIDYQGLIQVIQVI